jgi:hypothetical protein
MDGLVAIEGRWRELTGSLAGESVLAAGKPVYRWHKPTGRLGGRAVLPGWLVCASMGCADGWPVF